MICCAHYCLDMISATSHRQKPMLWNCFNILVLLFKCLWNLRWYNVHLCFTSWTNFQLTLSDYLQKDLHPTNYNGCLMQILDKRIYSIHKMFGFFFHSRASESDIHVYSSLLREWMLHHNHWLHTLMCTKHKKYRESQQISTIPVDAMLQ